MGEFKRGTNYMEKSRQAALAGLAERQVEALAIQRARCQQGQHDETTAQPHRVTYVGGRQVPPGTRYCRCCSTLLGQGATDAG